MAVIVESVVHRSDHVSCLGLVLQRCACVQLGVGGLRAGISMMARCRVGRTSSTSTTGPTNYVALQDLSVSGQWRPHSAYLAYARLNLSGHCYTVRQPRCGPDQSIDLSLSAFSLVSGEQISADLRAALPELTLDCPLHPGRLRALPSQRPHCQIQVMSAWRCKG